MTRRSTVTAVELMMMSSSRQPRRHHRLRGVARFVGTRCRSAVAAWWMSRTKSSDESCRWWTAGLERYCRCRRTGPTSLQTDHCHNEVDRPTPVTTASLIRHHIIQSHICLTDIYTLCFKKKFTPRTFIISV